MSSFFKQWDPERLAQIYITTDTPDFTICNNFFQIHDFDILKRVFNRKIQGRRIEPSVLSGIQFHKKDTRENSFFKKIRSNISPCHRLLRDILWMSVGFYTKDLKEFVNDFNPEIIFFQASSGVFAFDLTKRICNERKIPLVIQSTDDYITGRFTLDPFFWIHHFRLKKSFKEAFAYSTCIIAIGDKMAKEYASRFGGNYFVAMNAVSNINLPKYTPSNHVIKFTYAGNLGLNRWKMLVVIAECLAEIYQECGAKGELSIYSLLEPSVQELKRLNLPPFSAFKGALNTEELNAVKADSDILVHVEAFDSKNKHITRLSISTKIPEYLASGRCIFAMGPKDVASIQYIAEYDLGITVSSINKTDVKRELKGIMLNGQKRIQYAENGILIAQKRHNAIEISNNIFQIIAKAIDDI